MAGTPPQTQDKKWESSNLGRNNLQPNSDQSVEGSNRYESVATRSCYPAREKGNLVVSHIRPFFALFWLSLFVSFAVIVPLTMPLTAHSREPFPSDSVTLYGVVEDCFAKTIVPVTSLDVHVYSVKDAKPLLKILDRIQGSGDKYKGFDWPAEFNRLYSDLLRTVQDLEGKALSTRTDKYGSYELKNLNPGQNYLLLVINPDPEDNISYFESRLTGPLNETRFEMNVWMGGTTKETCEDLGDDFTT